RNVHVLRWVIRGGQLSSSANDRHRRRKSSHFGYSRRQGRQYGGGEPEAQHRSDTADHHDRNLDATKLSTLEQYECHGDFHLPGFALRHSTVSGTDLRLIGRGESGHLGNGYGFRGQYGHSDSHTEYREDGAHDYGKCAATSKRHGVEQH